MEDTVGFWKRPVGRPKNQTKTGKRYATKLISIEASNRKDKRFVASFELDDGKVKKIHFGLKNPKIGTFIDHGNKEIRKNYIARHSAMEKQFLNDPLTASSLSMYILWGPHKDINKNIEYFRSMFNI